MDPLLKDFSFFQRQALYIQLVPWDLRTIAFVESGKNKNLKNSRCKTGRDGNISTCFAHFLDLVSYDSSNEMEE